MLARLFLLFTIIPFIELYLLIQVGSVIGAGWTILLVIASGMAGAWLARQEGLSTMFKVRQSLDKGVMPADEMVEGFMILLAGILLITPGLMTDAFGLILLVPFTRAPLARWLRKRFAESARVHAASQSSTTFTGNFGNAGGTFYTRTYYAGDFAKHQQEEPRQAVIIDCDSADNAKADDRVIDCDAEKNRSK
ncbi:FxsA family protein [Oleidesulfovibrio sp.]|uniref:FxsA family protein n=1 Tax=Oleidesulfovibrio sp. TaxID=2909707 RepID=UPI003A870DB2